MFGAMAASGFLQAEVIRGDCGYPDNPGSVTYELDTETGEMVISGNGSVYIENGDVAMQPWADCRSLIKYVIVEDGVSGIDECAFDSCNNLERVEIKDDYVSLRYSVFANCHKLEELSINDFSTPIGIGNLGSMRYVFGCIFDETSNVQDGKQTKITYSIPSSLKRLILNGTSISINDFSESFYDSHGGGYTSLYTVNGYGNIKEVLITNVSRSDFSGAFNGSGLSKVKSVEVVYTGESVPSESDKAYGSESTYADSPFRGAANICKVTFTNVAEIPKPSYYLYGYFYSCGLKEFAAPNLTKIYYDEGLNSDCDGLFEGCAMLSKVYLPELDTIGRSTFSGCGITEIDFPLLKYAGGGAFSLCDSARYACLPDLSYIGSGIFSGCTNLTWLTLPYPWAGKLNVPLNFGTLFGEDPNMESGESTDMKPVTQVMMDGSQKLYYLPVNLDSVSIVNGCEEIPWGCFYNCSMIKSIVLPESLYQVDENAFFGCGGMEDIYCLSTNPPAAYDNSFDGVRIATCRLHVPAGTADLYRRSPGWERFFDIVEDADIVGIDKTEDSSGQHCYAIDGGIRVINSVGIRLDIYNLQGVKMYDGIADSQDFVVALGRGLYIVNMGDKSEKVSVK